MKSITAAAARRRFGEALKYADDLPLEITRHGSRHCYVLMSRQLYDMYEHVRQAQAEDRILTTTQSAIGKLLKGDDEDGFKRLRVANAMMKRFLDATGEKV